MSGIYTQAPAPGASGKFANSEKLPSPRLGMGAERSQTCGVPPFKASPSLKVLNSLLLVSSDALIPLAHHVRKLRSRNLEIAQTYCAPQSRDCANALRNLKIGAQFQDSKNAQRDLEDCANS